MLQLFQYDFCYRGLKLPILLARALNTSQALTRKNVGSLALNERVQLAQWTDLILFDYLIGHHDRFVNFQKFFELYLQLVSASLVFIVA